MKKIKIGTRGSKLALAQTKIVENALKKCFLNLQTEVVVIHTKGDKILDKPIYEIGDKGLFVSELEEAVYNRQVDIVVHSAKDLPLELKNGLEIICTLKRAAAEDILISRKNIKKISIIGTSSPRREFYIKRYFPDAKIRAIRGNVDTRLKKLENMEYDAIVLAKAGLDRLNFSSGEMSKFDIKVFNTGLFLPAACQGIIAIEARKDFKYAEKFCSINDIKTFKQYKIEREVLKFLRADCAEVSAVYSSFSDDNKIELMVMYKGREEKISGEYLKVFEKIPEIVMKIKS